MTTTQKILIVLTSHHQLGASGKPTGYWLPEVTHFYDIVTQAGYEVDFASPLGGNAPADPASVQTPSDQKFVEKIGQTLTAAEVKPAEYVALYFPGGHGPMWDLATDKNFAEITKQFYEQGKIVSAACHGPVALLPVKLSDGTPLLAGHTVTGFSNLEETLVFKKKWMPVLLEDGLKRVAARYTKTWPTMPHIEVSGRIITGQNPKSAKLVAQAVVKALQHLQVE